MQIQKQISDYLNGKIFFQNNFTQGSLKKNIINLTGEERFKSFSESYNKLYHKRKLKKVKIIDKIENLSIKDNEDFLKPLGEFRDYVSKNFGKEDVLGVYVHGSLGNDDYVPYYSDFDALIILKKEVFKDKKKLSEIKRKIVKANTFLYLLDPLQHHGAFIISELDMKYYFETAFPTTLFKYAKEVTNFKNKLVFNCLEDKKQLKETFDESFNILNNKTIEKEFKFYQKNSVHIKLFIQGIVFLPTIYLQFKNKKYIFKKDSFMIAKKDFNKNEWRIIDKCTKIRNTWKYKSYYPYSLRKFIGLHIHYKFLMLIHRYFDRNDFKMIQNKLGKNYFKELKRFLTKMKENLK